MNAQNMLRLAILVVVGFLSPATADDHPGEFSIPAVQPLTADQRADLRRRISTDSEAAAVARELADAVRSRVEAEPTPVAEIHYEGLVNTHPRRIATVEKLRQMTDVALLTRHWQATGDQQTAQTLRKLIHAWATTCEPSGNDVNDNKLYPLLVAYDGLRETFAEEQRESIDPWVRRFGEIHHERAQKHRHLTNRFIKRLRLLVLCGRILDVPQWQAAAERGVKRFVSHSLRADGSSLDIEHRDSLDYHASALRPVVELASVISGGESLYFWQAKSGASIAKSVRYVVPYASGEKVYYQWRNTKVDLDRRRAAAGIEKYQPGTPYKPQDARRLLEAAARFDKSIQPLARRLAQDADETGLTWQMLVNDVLAEQPTKNGEQETSVP